MNKKKIAVILVFAIVLSMFTGTNTFAASGNPESYRIPTTSVRQGAKGNDAYWLQAMLKTLGYTISVDGSFGPATLATVKRFQSDNGLSVDGSVGPATRGKLIEKYEALAEPTPTPKPQATMEAPGQAFKYNPDNLTMPSTSIRKGAKGDGVRWVQEILYNLNYDIDVDASFGAGTLNMVRIFQMSNGLSVDGSVGPATREKLTERWNAAKKTGKSPAKIICIDPGHQKTPPSGYETVSPWGRATKLKNTSGATGVSTKIPEYITNLQIALKIRDTLVKNGYKVVMTRDNNDTHLSNQQRAAIANNAGADITISIHCDSADSSSAAGVNTFSRGSGDGSASCKSRSYRDNRCASELLAEVCNATGATKRSAVKSDNYTGINWNAGTCIILECGFTSNETEDKNLNNAAYQQKIANGVLNFVIKAF